MADKFPAFKGMSAAQIASKINKSGLAPDSKEYVKDIASGSGAKDYIIQYVEDNDLLPIFGVQYSSGGLATKNYVNPVKVVDNRKKKND